jgi:hypothetical protein
LSKFSKNEMELYKMNSKGSSLDFSRQLEGGNEDS